MKKNWLLYCCSFLMSSSLLAVIRPDATIPNKVGNFCRDVVVDAIRLHVNLFSIDSAKVITGITPFYIGTRFIDEKIQCNFYDPVNHKNICQFPNSAHTAAKCSVAIPMVILSTAYLWGPTEDIRYTGWMTAVALPFVQSGKDIIKKMRTKACLRPWNEHFSKDERSSGGFPSGHMANVAFLSTLWGVRHGPKWAIPIALVGVVVGADFVNCNRHYVSQLVAGIGFGMIYGFAASKVVDVKLQERWSLNIASTVQGDPCLQVAYMF